MCYKYRTSIYFCISQNTHLVADFDHLMSLKVAHQNIPRPFLWEKSKLDFFLTIIQYVIVNQYFDWLYVVMYRPGYFKQIYRTEYCFLFFWNCRKYRAEQFVCNTWLCILIFKNKIVIFTTTWFFWYQLHIWIHNMAKTEHFDFNSLSFWY